MEQLVLCTICDPPRRHPMREPHIFASSEPEKPPKKNRTAAPPVVSNDTRKPQQPGVKGAETYGEGCPVCAARRAAKTAAQRRWREKQE